MSKACIMSQRFLMLFILFILLLNQVWAASPILDWIRLSDEALYHWETRIFPSQPDYISILPLKKEDQPKHLYRIIVLLPKRSSSYSFALSTFLEVLYDEDIAASLTVINYGNQKALGEKGIQYAEKEKADLIFSLGSETADFLTKHYNRGKIPVVTSTNKDPVLLGQMKNYHDGSGSNIAYTSLNIPIDIQIKYLLGVKPELKNVVILYNKNHKQVVKTEVEPALKQMSSHKLSVIRLAVSSQKKAKAELEKQLPQAIKQLKRSDPHLTKSVFWITSSTAVFSNIATINKYAVKIPVIGTNPNLVKGGKDDIVLGIGIDRKNNARLASDYAVKILRKKVKPGELKVGIVIPPDLAVNYKIAKKIGLKIPFSFFNDTGLSWLEFSTEVWSRYRTQISADNRAMMKVVPWFVDDDFIKKKILILLSKKSTSYSTAISKFLELLYQEKIAGDITIMNFAKDTNFGKAAIAMAEREEMDLIFSVGSETADFLHKNYYNAWLPVVTSTAKDPVALKQIKDYEQGSGSNMAFTSLNVPADIQMNYFLWLKPKLKTIGVLYNPHHKQVFATEVGPLKRLMEKRNLKVIDIKVDSEKSAKSDLEKRMPQAIKQMKKYDRRLKHSLIWMSSSTVLFSQMRTINQYAGNIPVISSNTTAVVDGDDSALMAFGINRADNAHLATLYAIEILKNNAHPGQFKVGLVMPPSISVNFRIAKKIGFEFPYDFFEKREFIYSDMGDVGRSLSQGISIE